MNSFQRSYCEKTMDKLEKRPICQYFIDVNPLESDSAVQVQGVKRPPNLRAVRLKLQRSEYKNINEWAVDIDYVFKRACPKDDKSRHYELMALEMRRFFRKKWRQFPRSEREHWIMRVKDRVKKAEKLAVEASKSMEQIFQSVGVPE